VWEHDRSLAGIRCFKRGGREGGREGGRSKEDFCFLYGCGEGRSGGREGGNDGEKDVRKLDDRSNSATGQQ